MNNNINSYSSNNATAGIWRGQVVENLGDGTVRVFIPTLHKGMNPFKTNIVQNTDENGDSQSQVEFTTELKEEYNSDASVPENEEQVNMDGSDSNKETTTDKEQDTKEDSKQTETSLASDNSEEDKDSNSSSSEESESKESDTNQDSDTDAPNTSESSATSALSRFPKAVLSAWIIRTELKVGDPVWITFENGDIEFPIIVGQFGKTIPQGTFSPGGSGGGGGSGGSGGGGSSGGNVGGTAPGTQPFSGSGGYSPLTNYVLLSPHCTKPRKNAIDTITIHHMAGNLSVEQCGNCFQGDREASTNYGIDNSCRIGCYVEEQNRSWGSASPANDHRAITIELANDNTVTWHVADAVIEKCIELCVDICKRHNIPSINFTGDKSGNLTMHKWFASTSCPGPYLETKFSYIAEQINAKL